MKDFADVVAFHGHSCGGLALGYKACELAAEKLGLHFSEDEEIVAVTETDSCTVDAIQVLLGCTAGKGNLFVNNWGKTAFSFYRRDNNTSIRLVAVPDAVPKNARMVELRPKGRQRLPRMRSTTAFCMNMCTKFLQRLRKNCSSSKMLFSLCQRRQRSTTTSSVPSAVSRWRMVLHSRARENTSASPVRCGNNFYNFFTWAVLSPQNCTDHHAERLPHRSHTVTLAVLHHENSQRPHKKQKKPPFSPATQQHAIFEGCRFSRFI